MIVSMHEEMNPSHRSTMEDCHVYYKPEELDFGNSEMSMLGVYDGHGGREIVEYLDVNLGKNIAQEIKLSDKSSISEKLERAFIISDVESRMKGIMFSGATVVVCLIKRHGIPNKKSKRNIENRKMYTIYTANCGDARAVLSTTAMSMYGSSDRKKSKADTSGTDSSITSIHNNSCYVHRLSTDDKVSDPAERERIESSGGYVIRNRVMGVLAISRSLGDHQFKEFVIGSPHTHEIDVVIETSEREEDSEAFVILACDGLWDVIEDEEAVEIVKQNVFDSSLDKNGKEEKKRDVAKVLIEKALSRGSTDNITVVVAWL